jgi:ATP-dependent DNA ligase
MELTNKPNYVGVGGHSLPKDLPRFEREKNVWAAEVKRDGCWCEIRTDENGIIQKLIGRSGLEFGGDVVSGLKGLRTPWPNTVLVGELETATEASTKVFQKVGYRRVWIFDTTILLGYEVHPLEYDTRRKLLEASFKQFSGPAKERLLLVEQVTENFEPFFNQVMEQGGEGLVLKKRSSLYKQTSSGRTDQWVRCKTLRHVDYFVTRWELTEKGNVSLWLALYRGGKFVEVGKIIAPVNIHGGMTRNGGAKTLVGKVIECIGAEVHDSGMLRHCRFNRIRLDKKAEECNG